MWRQGVPSHEYKEDDISDLDRIFERVQLECARGYLSGRSGSARAKCPDYEFGSANRKLVENGFGFENDLL
jgi:hypothetical protein